jgi:hypothetical protein
VSVPAPVWGIIEPCHARHTYFRRDLFTNDRCDARLSFFRDAAMIALRLVFEDNENEFHGVGCFSL